jgi:hypothetical protein
VTCLLVLNCSCRCKCLCNCLCNWPFWTVPLAVAGSSELFQIVISRPLKRVPCRLHTEHLLKGLSLSGHKNTPFLQETSILFFWGGINFCIGRYNKNASVRCLGKDVSKLNPLIGLQGIPIQWYRTYLPSHCLAVDVCSGSDIQAFRRHATIHYFIRKKTLNIIFVMGDGRFWTALVSRSIKGEPFLTLGRQWWPAWSHPWRSSSK